MKTKGLFVALTAITMLVFIGCSNPWWPSKGDVTVDFNANGGSGTVPPAQTVVDGASITVPPGNGLSKSGYYFDGWNTRPDLSGKNYGVGSPYKTSGSATLYARWVKNGELPYDYSGDDTGDYGSPASPGFTLPSDKGPPYNVTYLKTGADGGNPPPKQSGIPAYTEVPVKTNDDPNYTLTKNGYNLAAWQTGGKIYAFESKFNITSHMEFEPYWMTGDNGNLAVWIKGGDPNKTINARMYDFSEAEYGYSVGDGVNDDVKPVEIVIQSLNNPMGPFQLTTLTGAEGFKLLSVSIVDSSLNPIPNKTIILPDNVDVNVLDWVVKEEVEADNRVIFKIAPRPDKEVGNYAMTCAIQDDKGHSASFAFSFVVKPIKLKFNWELLSYSIQDYQTLALVDSYISPIQAGSGATFYSERSATFSVGVSGFLNDANHDDRAVAENVKLVLASDTDGLVRKSGIAGFLPLPANVAGVVTEPVAGILKKTFTVTVTLSDTTGVTFDNEIARIFAGVDGITSPNYDSTSYCRDIEINVTDGQHPDRAIPVNKVNGEALYGGSRTPFNAYASSTANGSAGLKRHYVQTEDIELTLPAGYPTSGSNWTRIGTGTSSTTSFTGSYDGDNKTISNLTMIGANSRGMFEYITLNGTVKNLGLLDVYIDANTGAGALTAGNWGIVENCYVLRGTVKSSISAVGGLVGTNREGGVVRNSRADDVTVKGTDRIGGLVGENYTRGLIDTCQVVNGIVTGTGNAVGGVTGGDYTAAANENGGIVKNSSFQGTVTGVGYVGGVVGYSARTGALVENCSAEGTFSGVAHVGGVVGWSTGTVTSSHAAGSVIATKSGTTGYSNAGGVVGYSTGTVTGSYFEGVSVTGTGQNVGGVVGKNERGTVENCYVAGVVSISGTDWVGGVVGWSGGNSNAGVTGCYSTGSVNGSGASAGGVVGRNDNGTVENCYATGNVTGGGNNTGGVAGSNGGTVKNCYATGAVINNGSSSFPVGGVVGQSNSGRVENCVALNPSVSIKDSDVMGRVVGTGGTLVNNYSNISGTWSNKGLTGKDGADIPAGDWNTSAFWKNDAKFPDDGTWSFPEGLPTLN